MNNDTKLDPLHNPAVWFSALLLVFPAMLLIDVFYVHPDSYDGNLRTQIVTGVLAVIMMVSGYWLGTVANGSQKKPADAPTAPVAPVAPAPALAPAVAVPGKESGHIRIFALIALAVIAGLCMEFLSGCAGLNAQGVLTITYNTPAVTTSATLLPGIPVKPASTP